MTLKERTLEKFRSLFSTTDIILEADGNGLTYYELRQFLTVLLKTVSSTDTKRVLDDLLKTVSKLEIMNVPVPVVKKQKTISPTVFS